MSALSQLQWDDRFLRELPADPSTAPGQRQVHGAAYSLVDPSEVAAPKLLAHSPEVAEMLGLDAATIESEDFVALMAGNAKLEGMRPWATAYGGHQFGNWARQLGDGRAISLGELLAPDTKGELRRWELQLKGAGPTPYSRGADGRAVLRSSIREFLCSEAMFHLGVPTTRALSLVQTGDAVMRDMFYDGNVKPEPGAIVCRVAPTFIRFGHFELPASRQDEALLRTWVRHTISGHFSELIEGDEAPDAAPVVLRFFEEVARRTAVMIAHWMRVGFVHGVMNTDNMSILGLTIDYGPYGWIDDYDPNWTPNTTDAQGRRYRFGAQPRVALWNLARLAEALIPLVERVEDLEQSLQVYIDTLDAQWGQMQAHKLGFAKADADFDALAGRWLDLLTQAETDMTLAYGQLGEGIDDDDEAAANAWFGRMELAFYAPPTEALRAKWLEWFADYRGQLARAGVAEVDRRARMQAANPRYVLRNYMAQEAIDAAEGGDPSLIRELLDLLRTPYTRQPERERWYAKRPDWARHKAGCSMLSCSS